MGNLKDSIKNLGLKVNGVEPNGETVSKLINNIADNYKGKTYAKDVNILEHFSQEDVLGLITLITSGSAGSQTFTLSENVDLSDNPTGLNFYIDTEIEETEVKANFIVYNFGEMNEIKIYQNVNPSYIFMFTITSEAQILNVIITE